MKKIVVLALCFCFLTPFLFAQKTNKVGLNFTIDTDTVIVPKYKLNNIGTTKTFFQMAYGSHRIINPQNAKMLKGLAIQKIEMVYTDYPKDSDMVLLNQKRLAALYLLMPELFTNPLIEWKLVKQTKVRSAEQAVNMFHGFVITYRPQPSAASEISYLKNILKQKEAPADSLVLKVLDRNKQQWAGKNNLVVADVTGSMSPYLAGLVLWLNLNAQINTYDKFVFFNDDDSDSHTQSTAFDKTGIWHIQDKNFDKVIDILAEAMAKGSHTENVLEALFYGMKKFPDTQEIILVADHWESPCDMTLMAELKKLTIPVRVVLCGIQGTVNLDYLEIARATGGSFHTIEDDISQTMLSGVGKTVDILGQKYRIEASGFVVVP